MPRLHRPRGPATVIATLVAVLLFYFNVPITTQHAPLRLLLSVTITVVSVGVIVVLVVREVTADLRGGARRLRGAHVVMLFEIALVAFALAYYTLSVRGSHQMVGIHTRLDALYFTATTMTTVGYGDIHPVGQLARAVTTVHLGFDVIFVAALAQLVNARLGRHDRARPDERSPELPTGDDRDR